MIGSEVNEHSTRSLLPLINKTFIGRFFGFNSCFFFGVVIRRRRSCRYSCLNYCVPKEKKQKISRQIGGSGMSSEKEEVTSIA